jgi:hypothetical protein
MARFTSASASLLALRPSPGVWRRHQEWRYPHDSATASKGGAAGKQALFLIPLTPEQNEFNVCAIAEVLGDIQRSGDDFQRSLKKGGDGHYRTSRIKKQG